VSDSGKVTSSACFSMLADASILPWATGEAVNVSPILTRSAAPEVSRTGVTPLSKR